MASILDSAAIRNSALPISVRQYQQLGRHGIISERTELIRGVIVKKMNKSPSHTWFVECLVGWIRARLPDGYHVRQEQPLTLIDSEPEPDVAIVPGLARDYREAHPASAALVIEVAISSEELDREKAFLYSSVEIEEYWIVIPDAQKIEVFTQPSSAGYGEQQSYTFDDTISCERLSLGEVVIRSLIE